MSVYFTSDLHLGHKLASEKRGFNSIREHNDAVIASLSRLNKRDMLWVLGDVAMNELGLDKISSLRCRLKLVMGNHDNYSYQTYIDAGFEELYGMVKYKKCWLTHCPIHPQEMYKCKLNIHGHIHKGSNSTELDHPYLNVNWDYHRKPVSLDEVKLNWK